MSRRKIPLGQRENERLEFKARDVLKEPHKVAREVVAMLNADGGEVWVGLEEHEGRASEAQGIEHADKETRALFDYLVESIKPPPSGIEVKIEQVPDESGRIVFCVVCDPKKKRETPYSYMKGGGHFYPVRIGDRIRLMTHEEIFERPSHPDKPEQKALQQIQADREKRLKEGKELFWLRIQPVPALDLDIRDPRFKEYLQVPEKTGNRRLGWNFASEHSEPQLKKDHIDHGDKSYRLTEVFEDGHIVLTAPLETFRWRDGGEKLLYPYALLELPVSVFRLAQTIYRETETRSNMRVFADAAFIGLNGWGLRPHSLNALGYLVHKAAVFDDDKDFVLSEPLVFQGQDLLKDSDECAYKLISKIYQAFGYREDVIPREFDRETKRLVFPA